MLVFDAMRHGLYTTPSREPSRRATVPTSRTRFTPVEEGTHDHHAATPAIHNLDHSAVRHAARRLRRRLRRWGRGGGRVGGLWVLHTHPCDDARGAARDQARRAVPAVR